MKVAQILAARRRNWQDLEQLCMQLESRSGRKIPPSTLSRFSSLYRSVCADLALADSYHLPQNTVHYLHQLVARAHNQLYRSRTLHVSSLFDELFRKLPRRLFEDNCLRLAFVLFWGLFCLAMYLAYTSEDFAESVVGADTLVSVEQMHEHSIGSASGESSALGTAYYIWHNPAIGLRCFAFGLLFGVGGLIETLANALMLGAIFGHMATVEGQASDNFFQFVTAHGPFELTAIVLAAGAGMRLGFSLVDTGGLTRFAALQKAAKIAVPTISLSIILFVFAALIEGYLSPSEAPYIIKALVGACSAGLLLFYFVILGSSPGEEDEAEEGPSSPFDDLEEVAA